MQSAGPRAGRPIPGRRAWQNSRPQVTCAVHSRGGTHYSVLGVAPGATASEIKSAYRQKALQYHPDVNKDPSAVELFKRCNEAYEVLSDTSKKRAYDATILGGVYQQGVVFSGSDGISVWEVMEEFFRSDITGSGVSGVGGASTSGRASGSRGGGGRGVWEEDSDDDVDAEELAYELEYEYWAATGSNYRSSFTASFTGANGRKKRANAAARAARAEAQARGASPGGGGGSTRRSKGGRGGSPGLALDRDAILNSLGPEARATAQKTFGTRLEKLHSEEELIDFFEVLTTLQDDMGIVFEVFSSAEAKDTYHRTAQRRSPRRNSPTHTDTTTTANTSRTPPTESARKQRRGSSPRRQAYVTPPTAPTTGSGRRRASPLAGAKGAQGRGRSSVGAGRGVSGGRMAGGVAGKKVSHRALMSWDSDDSDNDNEDETDEWIDVWSSETANDSSDDPAPHTPHVPHARPRATTTGREQKGASRRGNKGRASSSRSEGEDWVEVVDHAQEAKTGRLQGRYRGPFDDLFGSEADDDDGDIDEVWFAVEEWADAVPRKGTRGR